MVTDPSTPELKSTSDTTAPTQNSAATPQIESPQVTDQKGIVTETKRKGDGHDPKAGAAPQENNEDGSMQRGKEVLRDGQKHSPGRSSRDNSNDAANHYFSLSERMPIQIFNEETRLQKLSHWGPIVMGVASIVLTAFVWRNTEKLTSRQIDLQSRQINLQSEQVEAELADVRFKSLSFLIETDEDKKTPAEIGLAAHGLKAFPVVHYALGGEHEDLRKSAVNVVHRLFQAETNDGRDELLNRLMGEFKYPNKILHMGVVQSFVKVEPLLNPAQRQKVIVFLEQSVVPQNTCSDGHGREVTIEAAKFVGSARRDAIPYLLSVAGVPRCGDAWLQAMYNLRSVAQEISADERAILREKIRQIKQDVLGHLEENISKQELVTGAGFRGWLNPGQVLVNFEDFKTRIDKEFDTLILQLS